MNREGQAWRDSLQETTYLGEFEPWCSYRQSEDVDGALRQSEGITGVVDTIVDQRGKVVEARNVWAYRSVLTAKKLKREWSDLARITRHCGYCMADRECALWQRYRCVIYNDILNTYNFCLRKCLHNTLDERRATVVRMGMSNENCRYLLRHNKVVGVYTWVDDQALAVNCNSEARVGEFRQRCHISSIAEKRVKR